MDTSVAQPLFFKIDDSLSMCAAIADLLCQVAGRQAQAHATTYAGTVLQQLVAAKLDLLTDGKVVHHGTAGTEWSGGAGGEYVIADVAIHTTTTPSETLILKCQDNLRCGLSPMIVTPQ